MIKTALNTNNNPSVLALEVVAQIRLYVANSKRCRWKAPHGMWGLGDSAGSSRTWWGHQRLLAALTSRASADKAVGAKATPRSSFLPIKTSVSVIKPGPTYFLSLGPNSVCAVRWSQLLVEVVQSSAVGSFSLQTAQKVERTKWRESTGPRDRAS